jgi:hypothetical protein
VPGIKDVGTHRTSLGRPCLGMMDGRKGIDPGLATLEMREERVVRWSAALTVGEALVVAQGDADPAPRFQALACAQRTWSCIRGRTIVYWPKSTR